MLFYSRNQRRCAFLKERSKKKTSKWASRGYTSNAFLQERIRTLCCFQSKSASICVSSETQQEKNFHLNFYKVYVKCIQFAVVGLQRARPKKRLRGGDVRAKKGLKDEVWCSWNRIFFKVFIIGCLKKEYNGEAALCWSYFISFSWEATPLQHPLT